MLERFILSNISPFLSTTDNQFGFKAGQTASYFVTHGSSVHAVFLDASKAFDRVLHMKLFEKLIQRKVPINVFCAPTETLVQRTNDANKVGQAFFLTVSCV